MYSPGPSQSELETIEIMGIKREDLGKEPDHGVWPENWLPLSLFQVMETQWRWGPGGQTGLDYGAIPWEICGIKRKCRREVFEALQVLEASALETIYSHRD